MISLEKNEISFLAKWSSNHQNDLVNIYPYVV